MMAFENNRQLQQLLNYPGMGGGMGQQTPSFGMQQLPTQGGGGFWNNLKNFAIGTPGQFSYSTPYGSNQQNAFQSLLQSGLYNQQNPYEGFDLLQNDLINKFQQDILPNIANQFSSLGNNALSSPDFAKRLNRGTQGLAQQLLQHKLNYGQQNRNFGLQQAQMGLTPQYQQGYVPGQPGALQSLLGAVPQIAQSGLRSYFGGLL